MRLPKQNIFKWLLKNFGIGGFENYTNEQITDILHALKLILNNAGLVELEFLGKFLLKLSEDANKLDEFYDELTNQGY